MIDEPDEKKPAVPPPAEEGGAESAPPATPGEGDAWLPPPDFRSVMGSEMPSVGLESEDDDRFGSGPAAGVWSDHAPAESVMGGGRGFMTEGERPRDPLPVAEAPEEPRVRVVTHEGAPSVDVAPLQLEPKVKVQWAFEAVTQGLFLGALIFGLEWWWLRNTDWWPLALGLATGGLAGISFLVNLALIPLEYRAWRYQLRAYDVLLSFGVLTRVRRSVPRTRIQHVDIRMGPVDRLLGLARVTLYTAGSGEADATIPGLKPDTAERLRELLLSEELDLD